MTALAATRSTIEFAPEDEVDLAIEICGGDVRAALRISLIANAFLEAELDRVKAEIGPAY